METEFKPRWQQVRMRGWPRGLGKGGGDRPLRVLVSPCSGLRGTIYSLTLWGQGSELTFPEALNLLLELRLSAGHLMKPTTLSGHRIAQT